MNNIINEAVNDTEFALLKQSDLSILIAPYLVIGLVVLAMFFIIWIARMPTNEDKNKDINFVRTLKHIFSIHLSHFLYI